MYTMVPEVVHKDPQVPQWVLPAIMHKAGIPQLPIQPSCPDPATFRKLVLPRRRLASTLTLWTREASAGTPVRQSASSCLCGHFF